MIGTQRSIARVFTAALILAMFLVALPTNRSPALAYIANPVFSDQFLAGQLTEGLQWPDPTNLSADGQIAVFDEAGSNYGTDGSTCPPLSDYSATVQWGDGQSYPASVFLLGGDAANGNACQYQVKSHHTYAEEGFVFPVVSVRHEKDGSVASATSNGIRVADAPLSDTSVPAVQAQTLTEGQANNNFLLATFVDVNPGCSRTDYTVTVDWGDNSVGNAYIQADPAGGCVFDVIGTHTYAEEGNFNLNVKVIDNSSTVNMTDQITVNDAPLTSIGQSTVYGTEGASTGQQLLATFRDTDPGCALYDYKVSINWGDGTPADTNYALQPDYKAGSPCVFDVYGTHTYADENPSSGAYTGTVTVTDAGTPLPINFTASIADAPISTVSTGALAGFVEGAKQTDILIGTFHDTNPNCPTVEGTLPGQTYAEYGFSVNWGDGTVDTTGSANIRIVPSPTGACNFDVLGTHTYAEENFSGYSFTAVITDVGGSRTSFGANIPVADAPLTDVLDPNISGTEGQQLTSIVVGKFGDTDPGCLATDYTAVIDWGDGSSDTVTAGSNPPYFDITAAGGCTFNVIGTHIYKEEGTYKAVVTVHDTEKTVIQLPATVTVNTNIIDAPLQTVSNPGSTNETEGTPFGTFSGSTGPVTTSVGRLYLGTFNDTAFTNAPPNGLTSACDITDYTATIDWGDNATRPAGADAASPANPTTETSASGGIVVATGGNAGTCNFSVLGSYDYHEAGDYTVKITVVDSGGATPISWTVTMHVADAALSTTKSQNFAPVEGQPVVSLLPGQPAGMQYLGTIQDNDVYCNANDYTVTVDWGDGTTPDTYPAGSGKVIVALPPNKVSNCSFDVFGTHVYNEETAPGSPYQVTVTVRDDLSGSIPADDLTPPAIINDLADVADAPLSDTSNGPTLGRDNNINRTEGIQFDTGATNDNRGYKVPLGTIQDTDMTQPCLASDYQVVSINWGDGTPLDTTSGYLTAVATPNLTCKFDVNGVHTYAEESEPNTPYTITVVVRNIGKGTNFSTITLTPTATIVDAPLTALAGKTYTTVDSTYPYTSIPGPNGSLTGTGPNEQSSACWLLTKCTRLIATFQDTSTTCTAENESLTQQYTFAVDWGDGSTIDTTSAFAVPVTGQPCRYDVYATHVYTTPSSGPNGFTVSTTITDEGGATVTTTGGTASYLVVSIPTATPQTSTLRRLTVGYAYPPGRVAPVYVLSETLYHYKSILGYVGHIQFMDTFHYQNQNGLYIPVKPASGRFTANCSTTYNYTSQCKLTPLPAEQCATLSPTSKTAVWWGEYQYKVGTTIVTRYVKTELVQAGLNGVQDDFTITMSSPTNPANYVTSTPPIVPVNKVVISC